MEGAALSSGALGPDATFVGEDDLFHQRKPEPGAADLAMRAIVHAEKLGKKKRHGVSGNADAGICDRDYRVAAINPGVNLYFSALRRILYGIGEQVREHLAKPA